MTPEFYLRIFKNPQMSNFMKLCPAGAELLHEDSQATWQTRRSWQWLSALLRTRLKT